MAGIFRGGEGDIRSFPRSSRIRENYAYVQIELLYSIYSMESIPVWANFCSQLWGPSPNGESGSCGRSLVESGNR